MKYAWAIVGAKVAAVRSLPESAISKGDTFEIAGILSNHEVSCQGRIENGPWLSISPNSSTVDWFHIALFRPLTEDRTRTQSQVDKLKRLTAQSPISVKGVEA